MEPKFILPNHRINQSITQSTRVTHTKSRENTTHKHSLSFSEKQTFKDVKHIHTDQNAIVTSKFRSQRHRFLFCPFYTAFNFGKLKRTNVLFLIPKKRERKYQLICLSSS